MNTETIKCIGCGGQVPRMQGPTHRYLESSSGCWNLYGHVLAREYSDMRYMKWHRFTVDAYSLQHPGRKSPQTIQSVNVHLLALCAAIQHNVPHHEIPSRMDRAIQIYKPQFKWLTPPDQLGAITIVEVMQAKTPEEHAEVVQAWARCVWNAWSIWHEVANTLYEKSAEN